MKLSLHSLALAVVLTAAGAAYAETVTTLWEDDFEWLAPYANWKAYDGSAGPSGDAVGTNTEGAKAVQLGAAYTGSMQEGTALYADQALEQKGYTLLATCMADKSPRDAKQQIYLQKNYLKFGLTSYYSGIEFPVTQGANFPAYIEFDWCSQRQGSGVYDPTELVVIVKNGSDEQQFAVPFKQYEKNAVMHWTHEKIALTGATITPETRIAIRNADSQWPGTGALRFYLDNLKVYDVNPLDLIAYEDFEWFAEENAGNAINHTPDQTYDEIAINDPGKASKWSSSQYTGAMSTGRFITAYDKMLSKGYEFEYVKAAGKGDRNGIGSTVYVMTNYVKFGLTGYQSCISIPAQSSVEGTATLSFDWAPQFNGSGVYDAVELLVVVRNGNTVKKSFPVPAAGLATGEAIRWIHVDLPLEGVELNKGDFIQIRHADSQWPDARALRWYLDNFEVWGKSKGDGTPAFVAPEFIAKAESGDIQLDSDYKLTIFDDVTYTTSVPELRGEMLFSSADGSLNFGMGEGSFIQEEKDGIQTYRLTLAAGNNKIKMPELNNATITFYYSSNPLKNPQIFITGTEPAPVVATGDVRKAYAYDLSATAGENGTLNVKYHSTADAKNAVLLLFPEEGDAVVLDLPVPVKGLNEATVNVADLAAGSYMWQINITSELEGENAVVAYHSPAEWVDANVSGGVVWIRDTQSPAYGYTVVGLGNGGGFAVYNPEGELLTETPVHQGVTGIKAGDYCANRSVGRGDARGGLAVFSDLSYVASGAWVIDPLDYTATPYNMFMPEGATRDNYGIITYNGTVTGANTTTIAFQGEGDDTKAFAFDWSYLDGIVTRYDLGESKYITEAPSLVLTSYKSKFANYDIEVEPISEGFFVSQIRQDFNNGVYGLMYFNDEGELIWNIANKGVLPDATGHSISSGVAVNSDETRLALSGYNEIYVFDLDFNANGEPELSNVAIYPTEAPIASNYRTQLVFDAADNLHVFSTGAQGYYVLVLPGETTAATPGTDMLDINTTGIENINAANNAPVEYFNLHGIRVDGDKLGNGIYIRRQGSATSKVIVK